MINIQSAQDEYLSIIDSLFHDEIERLMNVEEERISDVVEIIKESSIIVKSYPTRKTSLDDKFEKFLDLLDSFWEKNEKLIEEYLKTTNLNTITLWPDEPILELAPKFLLYYDTVLIPDPIMNLGNNVLRDKYYRDVFMYFIILKKIASLESQNIDDNLFIIVPYKKGFLGYKELDKNANVGEIFTQTPSFQIVVDTFNAITNFGYDFKDGRELVELLNSISIEKLNKRVDISLVRKFLNFLIEDPKFFQSSEKKGHLEFITTNRLQLRSMTVKDYWCIFAVLNSIYTVYEIREFNVITNNSTNLITNIHFPFADFKYEKIKSEFGSVLEISDEQLVNYSLDKKFESIGNIDISTVKELRAEGELEIIRQTIKTESRKIRQRSFDDFPDISTSFEKSVIESLNNEHEKIKKRIAEIRRQRKITGVSFTATSALTISSIAFPALLPLSLLSAVYGITAGANVKELTADVIYGKNKLKELNKNLRPISVFLDRKVCK